MPSGLWSAAADIIVSDQTGESKDKFMKRCLTTVRSLLLQQLHRDPFHYTPGETTTTQLGPKREVSLKFRIESVQH